MDCNLTSNPVTEMELLELKNAAGIGPVLITTHHNPDPDGLAAGEGLAFLLKKAWGIESRLVYTGLVARVENRAMIKHLTYHWKPVKSFRKLKNYTTVALVDSQPECGNNQMPEGVYPNIVLDHHSSISSIADKVEFIDIRPEVGSVSTMIYQYLDAAKIELDERISTALFYGLKTDTRGLSRGTTKYDELAYFKLLSKVDYSILSQIEQAQLPLVYFQAIANAFRSTKIYGKGVVTRLGVMHRPDLPAEIADLLIRLEGTSAVICMGEYNNSLNISLRATGKCPDGGILIRKIVGNLGMAGGHSNVAGGQIDIQYNDPMEVEDVIIKRFLSVLNEYGPGIPLLAYI